MTNQFTDPDKMAHADSRDEAERLIDTLILAVQAVEDVSPGDMAIHTPVYGRLSERAKIARQNLIEFVAEGTK